MKTFRSIVGLLMLAILLTSCSHFQETSFGPYSDAEKLYQSGKYEKAIEKYQEYLGTNPQGNMAAIAEYYTGKSYAALSKPEEAKVAFQRVIERYPDTSWADFSKTQLDNLGAAK